MTCEKCPLVTAINYYLRSNGFRTDYIYEDYQKLAYEWERIDKLEKQKINGKKIYSDTTIATLKEDMEKRNTKYKELIQLVYQEISENIGKILLATVYRVYGEKET